ncbi:MAG: hypothetical protein JWP44_3333 [Mucilaginibacter sp.]|nr:hypothetical protein [Mucilaginibacter sp.]
MSFLCLILTKKQCKIGVFYLLKTGNFPLNFAKNALFSIKKCKNYTIDNFTNMQPVSGNVPGEITVIYTFYNDEIFFFLRVFTFRSNFFVAETVDNCH